MILAIALYYVKMMRNRIIYISDCSDRRVYEGKLVLYFNSSVFARGKSVADFRHDISTKKTTKIILIFCLQNSRRIFSVRP